jgi:hypothetical protein
MRIEALPTSDSEAAPLPKSALGCDDRGFLRQLADAE